MEKGEYLAAILRSPKSVFSAADIAMLWDEASTGASRVRLNSYARQGKLHRLRRGLYAKDRNYNRLELATRIFTPSYVSFETILAKEGLIFQFYDRIFVASYLSREVTVDAQAYFSRRIKNSILVHALGVALSGESSLATKERALLDTLYIHTDYHFDSLAGVDWDKVFEILPLYQNQRMAEKVRQLHARAAGG